jgi:hypothetical protein
MGEVEALENHRNAIEVLVLGDERDCVFAAGRGN